MKTIKKCLAFAIMAIVVTNFNNNIIRAEAQSETKQELKDYAAYVADFYKIDKKKFFEVATCESQWNPKADNPKSTAYSIFQFLTGSWKYFAQKYEDDKGVTLNRNVPTDNIRLAGWVFANDRPEQHWKECW